MLPEIGASELLVIAVVALIVVGPKDLPLLLRKLGQFMAKLRGMAAEFRSSFDEMARQSELDDLRREVEAMRRGTFADAAAGAAHADVHQTFDEIQHELTAETPATPAMTFPYPEMSAEPETVSTDAAAPARKPRARKAAAAAEGAAPAVKRAPAKRKPKAASEKAASEKAGPEGEA